MPFGMVPVKVTTDPLITGEPVKVIPSTVLRDTEAMVVFVGMLRSRRS